MIHVDMIEDAKSGEIVALWSIGALTLVALGFVGALVYLTTNPWWLFPALVAGTAICIVVPIVVGILVVRPELEW